MITRADLGSIRILFRAPDTLDLWGIPYLMRRDVGQAPRHLFRSEVPGAGAGWIWLGSPGWYGHLSRDEQALVREYVEAARGRDEIPGHPYEWCEVTQ